MRTSTKVVRLCAVVPTVLAGTLITAMLLSFLPILGVLLTLLCIVVCSLVLAGGSWESPAARVFGFAHGMRPAQRAAVDQAISVLEGVGLVPQHLLIRVADTTGPAAAPAAAPIGRHTVIIEPWLLQAIDEDCLTPAEAAAVIAQAVATQRVGPARFDLLARLWTAPWALVVVIARRVAHALSWVPAAGLSWKLRAGVGLVVVCQGFQPGGDPGLAVCTGAAIGLSYVVPAAERRWRRIVERDADRVVAQRGLTGPLVSFLQWDLDAGHLDRVRRIRAVESEGLACRHDARSAFQLARGPIVPLSHTAASPS